MLADLPHVVTGDPDPEDADSSGEDHLPDVLRYLLISLSGAPQFIVFDDPVPSLLEA